MRKHLLYIFLAILTLPLVLLAQKGIQQLLTRAAPQKANIFIDTKNTLGPVNPVWSGFAQGGEEPPPMLSNAVDRLKELSPSYIRLDHVYDSYSVVSKDESGFKYDFSRLDKTVDNIIASGALPFFSLSYMPPVFNNNGSLIEPPSDWNWWKDLVKATIEHYSGRTNKNLTNVYYEIWNEPELPQFGSWKLSAEKDYRLLYFYAANGASEAANVNNYYLGGPSVGSYYPNWVNNFLNYISQNNLRLDFYSWHRYTRKPWEYPQDVNKIRSNLSLFPKYKDIPLILSEWSIDSENSTNNNSDMAAAFTVSSVTEFIDKINLAFAFEIKDGPPPNGGKWGLLTHEQDSNPLSPKPRFKAFKYLSNLSGSKLLLSGEGTFVSGFASLGGNSIKIILSNFDPANKNIENVPVTISGLEPASYYLFYSYPLEDRTGRREIISTEGLINNSFIMPPNSIVYLELSSLAKLAN